MYFSYISLAIWRFNFVDGDNEGPWFMPDILVNVQKGGEESVGVIRELLPIWSTSLHVIFSSILFIFLSRSNKVLEKLSKL